MTLMSELRGHAHRHKISRALSLVNHLVRWEEFTQRCDLIAEVQVFTADDLRSLLQDCNEFWEYDPSDGMLTRKFASDEQVRMQIDARLLDPDDVYRAIAETEPAW